MEDGLLRTRTNNAGGILGGISNGMPVVCTIAVKPTSSIGLEQDTVDLETMKPAKLTVKGRHDPCICKRIIPVAEAMVAITLLDHLFRARTSGNRAPGPDKSMGNGPEPLGKLRSLVKQNDREMVRLLKTRMELTDEIGKKKSALGIPVKDTAVERAVIENALKAGRALGLEPGFVKRIMRTVVAESRLRQKAGPGTDRGRAGRGKTKKKRSPGSAD
jgi:chorismate mutase